MKERQTEREKVKRYREKEGELESSLLFDLLGAICRVRELKERQTEREKVKRYREKEGELESSLLFDLFGAICRVL